MLDNVGLRYPHRASGAKAPRTLRPLPLLRFAVSATGGAHLCSIQYYLRFWLSICRTSLAVSALRIMRYCLYNFTSISPAPESDCPSPLSPNRAYRSSSSAPPPQNKRHVPPYLYHKVGTCRYIIMILSRQSHQAMQPSAKLLRLAFSFCWLRLATISLHRPIRLVLKWKNGRSGTVKISTGRM